MGKKKRFYLNLETFRDIFHICPRVHGQDFDELPTDEVIVSFLKELGHTGEIKSITDVVIDQMHQTWRTFATLINRSLSGKTTGLDKFRATPPKITRKFKKASPSKKDINMNLVPVDKEPKSAKKKVHAKKTTRKPSSGVVLRDTHVVSLSKEKENVSVDKGKGIEFLSKVSLTEEAQTGAKPWVPDVTKEESTESEAESWGRDEDDSNNDHDSSSEGNDQVNDSGDDNTQSDNEKGLDSEQETDENETGSESDQQENEKEVEDEEEEKEDEFVKTSSNYTPTDDEDELMLNNPVHADEGLVQKEGTNAEMINVQEGNENLEITLDQVIEDAHVTISTVAKKTEVLVTSSSH
ncbi:hypothetical protein Tco_0693639 [Tanacetum coccineum]